MAAIEWFRLWHDMPNDPKWRTIARVSGQPIPVVISVALHVMVDASRNVTRGHVDVTAEDVASALDVTDEAVEAVLEAMQGRILDGDKLTGWEKRQPKREDAGDPATGAKSAAERKRLQRERERLAKEAEEASRKSSRHEESREVTLDTDTDTDKEVSPDGDTYGASAPRTSGSDSVDGVGAENPDAPAADDETRPGAGPAGQSGDGAGSPADDSLPRALGVRELVAEGVERQHALDWLKARKEKKAPLTPTAWDDVKDEAKKAGLTPAEAVKVSATNSWQGFKAKWYARLQQEGQPTLPTGRSTAHGGFDQRDYGTGGRL